MSQRGSNPAMIRLIPNIWFSARFFGKNWKMEQHLELYRDKVQLALDILEQIAPDLTEVDRITYLVKLLPPVEVLTSSELEMFTD